MTLPGRSGALETEADVIRTLDDGTYTIPELYELIAGRADIARDRGMEPPDAEHPTDRVWRRRVRGLLQTLRNTGNARRVSASVWALRGTREHPKQLVLIARGGTLQQIELLLKDAVALLSELEEPATSCSATRPTRWDEALLPANAPGGPTGAITARSSAGTSTCPPRSTESSRSVGSPPPLSRCAQRGNSR
jgi:hypothetical protein